MHFCKKKFLHIAAFSMLNVSLVGLSMISQVQQEYKDKIVTIDQVNPAPIAIILGASIKADGTPSDALHDRIETGIRLYRQGKVSQLLMTGDDGGFRSNEVEAMKRTAMENGIPEQNIKTDGHGYRTYESCERAVEVFKIKDAIVVTQRFHLSRALYLCSRLGMNAQGVPADLQLYQNIVFFTARDLAASLKAWWDINIFPPQPPVEYSS